jgi:hypothetical protein
MAPGKLPLAMFMALETLRQTGRIEEEHGLPGD